MAIGNLFSNCSIDFPFVVGRFAHGLLREFLLHTVDFGGGLENTFWRRIVEGRVIAYLFLKEAMDGREKGGK